MGMDTGSRAHDGARSVAAEVRLECVVARFNRPVSASAVADYTRDPESSAQKERELIEGNIALCLQW